MNVKKTIFIILSILLILLIAFMLLSFTLKPKVLDLKVYDGDNLLLSETYKVDHKFSLNLFFFHKNKFSVYLSNNQKDLALLKNINSKLFDDIKLLVEKNQKPPKNSHLEFKEEFIYQNEVVGYLVDQNDLLNQLFNDSLTNKIYLKKIVLAPDITIDDLKARTKLISSFSTDYSSSSANRKHNIKTATDKFDGKIFYPDEIISFNSIVGERTLQNGFLESVIINKGQFEKGVGGGVCQVSTTLYNALLYADLKIEHATAHSLPINYVSKSFDAMVSATNDLIAINNTPYPLYIKASANDSKVQFEIFGYRVDELEIRLRSELIKTIESNEYEMIKETEGEFFTESKVLSQPKCGYKTKGYKDFFYKGELFKTELIREDYYKPQKGKMLLFNKKTENLPLAI